MSGLIETVSPASVTVHVTRLRHTVLRYVGVLAALALLAIWQLTTQPQFGTSGNVLNILETNAALLVVAVGMTFVMLVGGFDLSVGGMLALAGVLLAKLTYAGVPTPLGALIAVAVAAIAGLVINGWLIASVGLSFFVVTIGSASIFHATSLIITRGSTQGLYENGFLRSVGGGEIARIPWLVVIAFATLLAAGAVTRYTGYGRMVFAVGGNPEAARLAGIPVTAVRISAYAISAALAGLAGVMSTGRLGSAAPDMGLGFELTAGAAVLIGGTSFLGGSGSMLGTFLGVLFMGVLANALTLTGISAFWQGLVSGGVLILAVLIDRIRPR